MASISKVHNSGTRACSSINYYGFIEFAIYSINEENVQCKRCLLKWLIICHLCTARLLEAAVDVRHQSKDVCMYVEAGSSNLINLLAVLESLRNLPETHFVATKNIHLLSSLSGIACRPQISYFSKRNLAPSSNNGVVNYTAL